MDQSNSDKANNNQNEGINSNSQEQNYPLEEIGKHNNENDCWLLIEGRVYDVTKFVQSKMHPGGSVILQGCGIDATELFNTKVGMGVGHSDQAHKLLNGYYIGELKK